MQHVFHVFPAGTRWEVTRGAGDHVLQSFATRNEAITWGMERARAHGKGQLKIYQRDHVLAEEFTFGEEPAFDVG